jgi:hypothetical protein
MNIDTFLKEMEEDFRLTPENIQDKMYTVPNLHSKYLKIFFREKARYNKMDKELNKLYREKYYFYTTKYDKLLENQKEIQFHILSDEEYAELNQKVENQKVLVDCVDRTLKKVSQLTFDIKGIIEYTKYLQGV